MIRLLKLYLLLLIICHGYSFASNKPNLVLFTIEGNNLSPHEKIFYQTALEEILSIQYDVYSGKKVSDTVRKISKSKKICRTQMCLEELVMTFNGELTAKGTIDKDHYDYLLNFQIKNVFDNKVEFSWARTCEKCSKSQVRAKLQQMFYDKQISKQVIFRPGENSTPLQSKIERVTPIVSENTRSDTSILVIHTIPSNAKVYIDGAKAGTTPYQNIDLSPNQEIFITLKKQDYHDKILQFRLSPGKNQIDNIKLIPTFGSLYITSKPSGADVYIAGVKVGKTPYIDEKISSGAYFLKLYKQLYVPKENQRIEIFDEQRTEKHFNLQLNLGTLDVQTQPDNIDIRILDKNRKLVLKQTTPHSFQLEPGNYRVLLEKQGYESLEFNAQIARGHRLKIEKAQASLRRLEGKVIISTKPYEKNAKIYINDKQKGIAPGNFTFPVGKYEIEVRTEHKSGKKEIIIEDRETVVVEIELETINGELYGEYGELCSEELSSRECLEVNIFHNQCLPLRSGPARKSNNFIKCLEEGWKVYPLLNQDNEYLIKNQYIYVQTQLPSSGISVCGWIYFKYLGQCNTGKKERIQDRKTVTPAIELKSIKGSGQYRELFSKELLVEPFKLSGESVYVNCINDGTELRKYPNKHSPVVKKIPWMASFVMIKEDTDFQEREWINVGELKSFDKAKPLGWILKDNLLMHQKAIKQNGVYKKAIVGHYDQNNQIIGGTPIRKVPLESVLPTGEQLTLFNIYYIYDKRNDFRTGTTFFLLGDESQIFDPLKPENTIVGWVNKKKLFEWNTREAAEYDKSTLNYRKPVKIYETEEDLKKIILKDYFAANIEPLATESTDKTFLLPSEPRFPIITKEREINGIKMWRILFIGDEIRGPGTTKTEAKGRQLFGKQISGTILEQRAIDIMKRHGLNPYDFARKGIASFVSAWVAPIEPDTGIRAMKSVVLMNKVEVETLIALLGRITKVKYKNIQQGWAAAIENVTGDDVSFDPRSGVPAEIINRHLGIPVRSGVLNLSFQEIGRLPVSKITEAIKDFKKKLFLLRAVINEKDIKFTKDKKGNISYVPTGDKKYWFGTRGCERVWLDAEIYLP